MPELPPKKIGIVSCSGEELPEGTVSRLAALEVLEKQRPGDTVTICLPLFLAGGESDRAFAKFYPTIAIDGCEKRCAYRGTEKYSNKPVASIVVTELADQLGLHHPQGKRRLDDAGRQLVDAAARQVVDQVDSLLGKHWDRRGGAFTHDETANPPQEEVVATCACGSGIPVQNIIVAGQKMTIIALPVIFENFAAAKQDPSDSVLTEIMDQVKIYNGIEPDREPEIRLVISHLYEAHWQKHEVNHG